MTTQNLLVELFVEELPPKALKKLGEAFAGVLADQLKAQGLADAAAAVTAYASPRRLAAHVSGVRAKAADKAMQQKLMPVSVGLDAAGNATPALLKKLQALGADVSNPAAAVAALKRQPDGKAEALFYDSVVPGAELPAGLQKALDEALAKLPIPKVMQYQLETDCELPGWSSVNFVRPAHKLIALHGSAVVPVKALGLTASHSTQGHRFEAKVDPVVVPHADQYAEVLKNDGAVIASFAERRAEIVRQLNAAAAQVGGGVQPIEIVAALKRELDSRAVVVQRDRILAPHAYTVGLSAQDFSQLNAHGTVLIAELVDAVREYAHRQRYSFAAPVTVSLAAAADIPNGVVRVMSQSLDAVTQWQPAVEVNGETIYLTETESIIGRGATATIVINDGGASRNHARIVWNGKAAGLEDLQSTNGTRLDGRPVKESGMLADSVITAGATQFVFRVIAKSVGNV